MDSFELNKIIGAILGTLLFVMGVGFLAEGIYAPITGPGASYNLPEPSGTASTSAAAAATPALPLPQLLAAADPSQGEQSAKKCQACHDFTKGGPNKIGPNLYGVVGRKIASHPDFAYSEALLKFSSDTWTYEHLSDWLASPKNMAPGTKMTFAGIPDDTERANVLAYLKTLSDTPVPFPAVAAAPAAAPAPGTTAPATATPAATTATPTVSPAPAAAAPAAATPAATTPAATAPAAPAPAATAAPVPTPAPAAATPAK